MRAHALIMFTIVLLSLLGSVRAEGNGGGIERNFAGPPPDQLRTSARRTLTWVDVLGDRRLHHVGGVSDVAFSPDGIWLVTGSGKGTLKIWETKTGREIRSLPGRAKPVAEVAVGPKGRRILASYGAGFDVWDAQTGARLHRIRVNGTDHNTVFALSPDGAWAVHGHLPMGDGRGSSYTSLGIWDTRTGKRLRTLTGHNELLDSIAVSRDGTRVAAGALPDLEKITLWDASTGRLLRTFRTASVSALAFGADGRTLIVHPSLGRRIEVWRLDTWTLVRTIQVRSQYGLNRIALSADGSWVVGATLEGLLQSWDVDTGAPRRRFDGDMGMVDALAVSPDGATVVSGRRDGAIRVWNAATGGLRPVTPPAAPGLTSLALSADGRRLVAGTQVGTVKIWDRGKPEPRVLRGHEERVHDVDISADGTLILSGALDGLRAWDAASGKLRWTVASRTFKRSESERVMDKLGELAEILFYLRHRNQVHGVALDPQGGWLASCHLDGTVEVRDAPGGQPLRKLGTPAEMIFPLMTPSPDGTWLAVAGAFPPTSQLKIWELPSGRLRHTIRGHDHGILALAVEPKARWLVSASADEKVKIWDVATGRLRRALQGHTAPVSAVAVASDGSWVVSGAQDGTLRTWDVETGAERDRIRVDGGPISGLVVRGNAVHASLANGTVNVYEVGGPAR